MAWRNVVCKVMSETARCFEQDGFVVLAGLFSEEQLRPVSDEVDREIDGRAGYIPAADLIYEPGVDPPRLRNAFRLHLYNHLFMRVPCQPALVCAVESILGLPVRLYSSGLFAKPAEAGSEVPRHQDMPYWPFEPYEMLTAWIALDDSTLENACVLHHCLTVHRSEPNRSPAPRRGLTYVFMSPNVRLTDASRLHGPALFPTIGSPDFAGDFLGVWNFD